MAETSGADRDIQFPGGLPPKVVRGMADYLKKYYLDPGIGSLSQGAYRETQSKDGTTIDLEWSFWLPMSPGESGQPVRSATAHLAIGPMSASITFGDVGEAGEPACRKVADEVEVVANTFLLKMKTTSLYFIFSAWEEGATRDVPSPSAMGGETLRRLLSGNMMNLYLLIMALSFGLFFILGDAAIFAVLAIQLVALFYSDRIAILVGRVRPTSQKPDVTMVCVPVSVQMRGEVAQFAKSIISDVSDRLQAKVTREALEGPDATKAVQGVLAGAGIKSSTEDIRIVTRNVYGLVKGVADRFRLPVPKIAIVNTLADNAAATGVSPGRASITITAGSLEDLPDDELSTVIGHELGHIKGRDSLTLFFATFVLYVGGLYLWFPVVLFLGLFYYIVIFAIIFAIGKVLETRADTESVANLGEPGVLASALASIGFRQLYAERYSHGARFLDWLSFDPHPPIYFRVQRLTKLAASGQKVGNTLLVSIRDCISGFFEALA